MDLKLVVAQGKNVGQHIAITGQAFLIGRAEDCHLRPGSEMISRHHCVIVVDQSYVAVRDFGSKNGTFVNGQRIVGECELQSGDQLRVGPLEFAIFMRQGELGGRKKPPVQNARQAAERTAAGQPDQFDVARFLADSAGAVPSAVDTRCPPAIDTQSIHLSKTEQIAVAANVPKRPLPSTFQMPAPEPETPATVSPDKSGRLGKDKVFAKLPVQKPNSTDTRSAAANLLDRLRKRR